MPILLRREPEQAPRPEFIAATYQMPLSDEWGVTHNLGWYPQVLCKDQNGHTVEGDLTYINVNQFVVRFSEPVAGMVYIS